MIPFKNVFLIYNQFISLLLFFAYNYFYTKIRFIYFFHVTFPIKLPFCGCVKLLNFSFCDFTAASLTVCLYVNLKKINGQIDILNRQLLDSSIENNSHIKIYNHLYQQKENTASIFLQGPTKLKKVDLNIPKIKPI